MKYSGFKLIHQPEGLFFLYNHYTNTAHTLLSKKDLLFDEQYK